MNQSAPPIVQKSYEAIKLIQEHSKQIARFERYTIWQTTQTELLEFYKKIYQAGQSKIELRQQILIQNSAQLELVKSLIRLCFESKVIDKKKYFQFQVLLDEIGRMLGGWIKSCKQ